MAGTRSKQDKNRTTDRPGRGLIRSMALLSLTLVLILATFQRNAVWNDDLGLWHDAVQKIPNKPRALNNLGFAYNTLRHYDLSIEAFDRSLKRDSDNVPALLNRGLAYHELKQYDRAIEDYSKVLSLTPGLAQAWFDRGLAHAAKGAMAQAIADFSRAIEQDPGYRKAYRGRARAYARLGQQEKALEDQRKAESTGR